MKKTHLPDDAEILAVFDAAGRRPLHVREVAEQLGLPFTARHALTEALDALCSRGLLGQMPGSRYRRGRDTSREAQGRFSQNPRGFGFVLADDGGPDVFIPPTGVGGAMHGDRVAFLAQPSRKGREGVVTRVVERRPPRVPGVLRTKAQGAWVEPDDARIRGPITVDEVGSARDGEAVVCEITRWPEHAGELPVGLVRESLGRPGQLDVEVAKVLLREGVEEDFPEAALAEAEALEDRLTAADYEGREDLRHLPLLTIDPDDARDHDDAVHVERRDDGGYTALVAIADVSHYVRPGTGLDEAALARGTSVYLPDRAIPMLPRQLSSHLASLVEGEDRLTLAVEVQISAAGKIEKTRLIEGVMRCAAGLTYSIVARELGWLDTAQPTQPAPWYLPHLEAAAELSAMLRAKRMRRGSLDFDLPEARVRFADDKVTPVDIVQSKQDPGIKRAYSLIEELMLLANEVVAQTCEKRGVPTIYRVHGAPEEDGVIKLSAVARAYGYELEPEDARDPKALSKFLRKIAGTPQARVLGMLLLRSMPQAVYSVDNRGHFGLAAEAYLHFTSPIRRYPDVVAHRVVRSILRKEKVRDDEEALEAMRRSAAESSRLERRAMEVEREVMDLYRCVVAQTHVGEVHAGVVTGLSSAGPFVQLERPFLDVLVRVGDRVAEEWEIDELGLHMRGARSGLRFVLGDEHVVELTEVSLPRRTVYGVLPEEAREALRARSGKGGPEKHRGKSKGKGKGAHEAHGKKGKGGKGAHGGGGGRAKRGKGR